jgi:hypothetical protein
VTSEALVEALVDALEHVSTVWIFNLRIFYMLFLM